MHAVIQHLKTNWQSGVTVALISVPLSIALSVASGAGPVPGVITGIWATLIASVVGSSNYNIIGAAGALTTVLFAATLAAPAGLGAAILPLIALTSGAIILFIAVIGADRFLYYIPSSIMYGFAGGVAFLIAASQLFDATGLSTLKRTGTFVGDIELYLAHIGDTHITALTFFVVFLGFILVWKRFVKKLPAVIPAAVLGIAVGFITKTWYPATDLLTLGDKFGSFTASLVAHVPWSALPQVFATRDALMFMLGTAGTVALISILETLITAQIADKITKTQSGTRRELFGLALANIGSGLTGGLPATGVFIRTGANIKAGATHRTSATIAALATAVIALVALPYFTFIPMAVIAAMLVNTALGLIEIHKFVEFYLREKQSFFIAALVLLITVFADAGTGVVVGAVLSLLFFADRVSHGYYDVIFNHTDGTHIDEHRRGALTMHTEKPIAFVTYSIAGFLGYIDAERHAANLRILAASPAVPVVILRLRNLYSIDYEGEDMLVESIKRFEERGTDVYLTSSNTALIERLCLFPTVQSLKERGHIFQKSEDAIHAFMPGWHAHPERGTVAQ